MAVLSAAIENSSVDTQDDGSAVVSVVLAGTVTALAWRCYSTLQTYCHTALRPPNVFSYPPLGVPSHGSHSVEDILGQDPPVLHPGYAEPASFVHIRLAVYFRRSHVAPAESLLGDVNRQHQVRAPAVPVIAASLQVL